MKDFENDIPIDDEMMVLDLLVRRWNDSTTREIIRIRRDPPYLRICHCHDFSSDTIHDFLVTDRVVDALLANYSIVGKPQWGYTDMNCLRASEFGETRLWDRRKELETVRDEYFNVEYWFVNSNIYERVRARKEVANLRNG